MDNSQHLVFIPWPLAKLIIDHESGISATVLLMQLPAYKDEKFQLPSYMFFAYSGFLSSMIHFQTLQDEHMQDMTEFKNSNSLMLIRSFENSVLANVLFDVLVDKDLCSFSLSASFGRSTVPLVYLVGSILNRTSHPRDTDNCLKKWLDEQTAGSVVFLCFESQGVLSVDEVEELAHGLVRSGCHFILASYQQRTRMQSPRVKNFEADSRDREGGGLIGCRRCYCYPILRNWDWGLKFVGMMSLLLRILMESESESEARKKVKEMNEKSRMSMEEDGSSLGLVHRIMTNETDISTGSKSL
ncbi:unnamed protein product [Fraxinus pennsylvanica]|uniref:Uncharacterized protein n=1 Tax=Fraxinus pennsylvanica TaxID=56036 RepID=A0AAD1YXG2_9LAMI|nr:unnamed protein product [Fraxinus pennsylvanica]